MSQDPLALGLIGHPLSGSRSPDLHHAALRVCGLAGSYNLYPIEPLPTGQSALDAILRKLRDGEIHGLNVTIPHKQIVLDYLDEASPTVQAVGAANTLYMDGDRMCGDNTDVPGFLADLERTLPDLPGENGRALVLGAGGSARAVVYGLASAGWAVSVAARRPSQAQGLLQSLGLARSAQAIRLEAGQLGVPNNLDLVVNTTPVGMIPYPDASPWPENLPLPEKAALYDLVYKPLKTALVRQFRSAGLPAASGLGMLVEQAALSFERWTGCDPDRDAMWDAVAGMGKDNI